MLMTETTKMNQFDFNVRLTALGRTAANLEAITTAADRALWQSAAQVLTERVYRHEGESVRVRIDWQPLAEAEEDAATLTMQVFDGSGRLDVHHALSFAELFLHDAFLLLNIAVPGSFGGVITIDDDEHVHELALEAYLFEFAWVAASGNTWPAIEPLPLPDVIAWYDSQQLGTAQVAPTNTAAALFHLLHLARRSDSEPMSILRAAQALEALFDKPSSFLRSRIESLLGPFLELADRLDELFTLRDAIVTATAPITHPMHDDALDPRVDDESLDWTEPADFAASVLIAALQALVRKG
jgi:Asp-tRNA(Asn)/Glu-tRNA(Gln) amidotransferase A subunit family amidase